MLVLVVVVVVTMVVVGYLWCHSGVDSLCKGGSYNSCKSL